jgi:rhodanese-related sulfurtransferase
MNTISRCLLSTIVILICFAYAVQAQSKKVFVCLPCGSSCDTAEYSEGGQCSHCQMPLVEKSSIKHKSVQPDAVCKFIASNPNLILLDVRTKAEYEGTSDPNFGTLKNAINIPVQELESRLAELSSHKNKTILVFCSHSHRSPRASYLLTQNGFKTVFNMEGGMSVMEDGACKK